MSSPSRVAAATIVAALACLTLSSFAIAKAKPPKLPTTYGGTTSDGDPFALVVTKNHHNLVRLLVHARADCPDGSRVYESGAAAFAPTPPTAITGNTIIGNKLAASGRFSLHGVDAKGYGSAIGLFTETLTGKIKGRKATGTFQMTVAIVDATTEQTIQTCSSQKLTWTTQASPGNIYVGLTADQMPVVITLAQNRGLVRDLRIAWRATCQPEGSTVVGDHLANFVIRGSRFGSIFDAGPFTDPDGTTWQLHYDVHGSVSRTVASGTFAATYTQQDSAGATTTCAMPAEQWSATG
jgi:hypothetical protein